MTIELFYPILPSFIFIFNVLIVLYLSANYGAGTIDCRRTDSNTNVGWIPSFWNRKTNQHELMCDDRRRGGVKSVSFNAQWILVCAIPTTKSQVDERQQRTRHSRTWAIKTNLDIHSFTPFHAFHSIYCYFNKFRSVRFASTSAPASTFSLETTHAHLFPFFFFLNEHMDSRYELQKQKRTKKRNWSSRLA